MMTNAYFPQVGGVAGSVDRFTEALRDMGHRVVIVAPTYEDQPEEETDVVRVPAVQNFNGSDFSVSLPVPGILDETLESFHPDIVHAHHPFLIGSTALRVARRLNIPLIYTYHTQYEYYTHYVPLELPRMQAFVIRLSAGYAELADGVIAPSESIADLLQEREVHTPITVVPTGIFPERFAPGDGTEARHELGIPAAIPIIGHVGRLAPEKNLDFLGRAVAQILGKHDRAVFLVVGHGPSAEGLRQHFNARGLGDRLVLPGSLTGKRLVDAYHAMDLFVFASQTETQGMVLTEAMAAGLPVIGLDAPGVREVVDHEGNGLLVDREEVSLFCAALETALQWTPEQWAKIQETACRTAERFAMPRCAERLLTAYDDARSRLQTTPRPYDETSWQRAGEQIKAQWQLWSTVAGAVGEVLVAKDADAGDDA
jgi:glycosyltransferase involved in cell wall biosynthesis